MTKHNILVLCGLVAALSLQAKQLQPSQPASQQTAADQENASWSWRKKLGVGAVGATGLGGTLAAGSYAAPGWGSSVWNKGSDALSSARNALGSGGSYLWNKGGNVLGSAGGYASRAWDWSKGVPGAGVVPRGLGQLGSISYDYGQKAASAGWQGLKAAPSATWEGLKSAPGAIAGYATNPYIAQNIAQRLPSASFVKDYPGITNVAAALATGYALSKGGQYAANWYYGPLDAQLAPLLTQEDSLNAKLHGEHKTVTLPSGATVLTQQGGLVQKFNETSDRTEINTIQAQIRNIELQLGNVNNQIRRLFVAKVNEIIAQVPSDQKIATLEKLLDQIQNTDKSLPDYYNDPRFFEAAINKLESLKNPTPGYFSGWFRGNK